MRITNSMLIRNMMTNLNFNLNRMERYQRQAASGRKFDKPSEDPIGMSKSLKLYTDISRVDQYERNLNDANSWMHSTENALIELNEIIHRVRELSVDMANGTKTVDDTQKSAEEIKQLKEQVIKLANSRHAGRSIFTGFKTDQDLLDKDGKYIINVNKDDVSIYNVGISENIKVNTVGINVFGVGDDYTAGFGFGENATVGGTSKSTVIDMFDKLITAMGGDDETGTGFDQKAISDMLGDIDKVHENTLAIESEIGAKTNRLKMTEKRLSSEKMNFRGILSLNEDVDHGEVIMEAKMAENIYNASLAIGSRIIQPTLVDFLR